MQFSVEAFKLCHAVHKEFLTQIKFNNLRRNFELRDITFKLADFLKSFHTLTFPSFRRFGKRGNDFMTKEFTNNYLRYLLENPPEVTN